MVYVVCCCVNYTYVYLITCSINIHIYSIRIDIYDI